MISGARTCITIIPFESVIQMIRKGAHSSETYREILSNGEYCWSIVVVDAVVVVVVIVIVVIIIVSVIIVDTVAIVVTDVIVCCRC